MPGPARSQARDAATRSADSDPEIRGKLIAIEVKILKVHIDPKPADGRPRKPHRPRSLASTDDELLPVLRPRRQGPQLPPRRNPRIRLPSRPVRQPRCWRSWRCRVDRPLSTLQCKVDRRLSTLQDFELPYGAGGGSCTTPTATWKPRAGGRSTKARPWSCWAPARPASPPWPRKCCTTYRSEQKLFLNLDDPFLRDRLESAEVSLVSLIEEKAGRPFDAIELFHLVLDEAQKAPKLFEVVKALYDAHKSRLRILLTGSSALGIHDPVAETMAGRVRIYEIPPFHLSEAFAHARGQNPTTGPLPSLMSRLLRGQFTSEDFAALVRTRQTRRPRSPRLARPPAALSALSRAEHQLRARRVAARLPGHLPRKGHPEPRQPGQRSIVPERDPPARGKSGNPVQIRKRPPRRSAPPR